MSPRSLAGARPPFWAARSRARSKLFLMRTLALAAAVLAWLIAGAVACAPKTLPAPVVTAPRFPEFIQPPVPSALAASPAVSRYNRAWRFFQAGDLKNAERELAAALTVAPAFYPAQAASGYLDLQRKDPKEAVAHFDRALEDWADYTPALIGRGQALVTLNREAEAVAAFEAALVVDPSLTKAFQAGKIVQELTGILGGKGGGRPDMARGVGKDHTKLDLAKQRALELTSGI